MSVPGPLDNFIINYKPVPTGVMFHGSDTFYRGIMGPIGSAKSVTCVMELFMRSKEQAPGPDGVRRTRHAIIRNTSPELKSTTIKTWQEWVPDSICHISYSIPITGRCIMPLSDGTTMDMEVIFLALDQEIDVKKLKSLELTMAWFNEASEILHTHVTMAGGRVDRYPGKRFGGCSYAGVIMDTNPPDEESWWYLLSEIEKPSTYQFWRQPPAVLPVPKKNKNDAQMYVANKGQTGLPPAENAENHNSGFDYWLRQCAGAKEAWIKVYLMAQYGSTMEGKAIYPDYNDDIHCAQQDLEPHRGLPLILGFDYGHNPTCVIAQQTIRGQLRIINELIAGVPEKQRLNMDPERYVEDMGVRKFARQIVKPYLQNYYPGMEWQSVGDPAGSTRNDSNEISCIQELAAAGIPTEMARTNKFTPRREAVDGFLLRMVDGHPGLLVSPRCRLIRKGFQGAYRYRTMRTQYGVTHATEPEKNIWSHPHDGLQYIAMHAEGGGAPTSGDNPIAGSNQAYPIQESSSDGWT